MSNLVKISTIGSEALRFNADTKPQEMVNETIEHWKSKFTKVLPDKPDLIVVPEACDRPEAAGKYREQLPKEIKQAYYHARKNQIRDYFASVARENNCYIVYSAAREIEDGSWRNSSVILDRKGQEAGIYNKNHVVIEETTENGILCGASAELIECDFGKIACVICFDLNFEELRKKYEALKPDLIVFSSMYHGGLMQAYWAYACRCHFVGAICGQPSQIRNPVGDIIASTTNYIDYVTVTVNLDCRLAHLDYNWEKFDKLKQKYGPAVQLSDPGYLGSTMITSCHDEISVEEMIKEFEIEKLDDYFARALKHRHTPGNMENL